MNLSINTTPATMALVGNPIKLDIASESFVTYTIRDDEKEYFTGSGEGSFSVFIQDILANIVQPAVFHNESPGLLLPASGNTKNITIVATNDQEQTASTSLVVFVGGVSKRALYRLNEINSTIFTHKLLNPNVNFFQTTRTSGRVLSIRETELLPISFIYPAEELSVISGEIETAIPGVAGQSYALNLYRLRKALFEQHYFLASVFDVYAGGVHSCTIVITAGTVSRERYLLEFLNSYGSYERIEVTGTGNIKHEQEEESSYQVYNELVDDYIEARERQRIRDSLIVQSGYRTAQELSFLIDMLSSDDIRLLDFEDSAIKVNVTAEELTRAVRPTVPEGIPLTIRFADSERYHTGSLFDDDFESDRIHVEQFTEEFN